ncbi:MAG: c-type cytochrome [Chloroflexi bacterium]|nr:c-type cytochrome [Chloroflexota bacterium]
MDEEEKLAYKKHYEELKKKGSPFFPDVIIKDALMALFVFLVILFLATFLGAPLENRADPTGASKAPRPEWYFLFLFELLKYFPGKLEFVGALVFPTIAILVLLLLPFFDRNPRRHPAKRPVAVSVAVLALAGLSFLTFRGATAPAPPVLATAPEPGARLTPLERAGLRVYQEQSCGVCHQINGVGGGIGADLSTVGKRLTPDWLFKHLENPQALAPGSAMPTIKLTNDDLMALTAYLLSRKVKEAPTGAVEGALSPAATAGKAVFTTYCNACHPGGNAGIGPKLVGDAFNQRYAKDDALVKIIRQGKGSMPASTPEQISDQKLSDLIAYLRALKEAK